VKLITQCQKEFERHKEESIVFNDIEEKLREIENLPEQQKLEEKARLDNEHDQVQNRAIGTVKFLGVLFMVDMLTVKIMRACIEMLLQEVTEEKIERVCVLMTTIGWKMEQLDGRQILDKYFQQLHEMLHPNHKIVMSSRIKFEIQNLEDLRNSQWKSRRQDLTPKTMDQIVQDAENEQQMINFQTRQSVKDDRQRGGNQGGYGGNRRQNQQQQDSDGWSVQQNKSSRTQPLPFKQFALPSVNTDGPTLGKPTSYQNFMVPNTNKFAALPVDTEMDGRTRAWSEAAQTTMATAEIRNLMVATLEGALEVVREAEPRHRSARVITQTVVVDPQEVSKHHRAISKFQHPAEAA
jgi:hypothetical protein